MGQQTKAKLKKHFLKESYWQIKENDNNDMTLNIDYSRASPIFFPEVAILLGSTIYILSFGM